MRREIAPAFIALVLLSNFVYGVSLDVPFFSQYDCGDKLLGPSDGPISVYGCALTSVAMVLSYYGVPTNPCALNDDLMSLGGVFADDGSIADWDRVRLVSDGKVTALERIAPFDMSDIDAALAQRYPVIAHVKFGVEERFHFIVFWGNDDGAHYFYDPADGTEIVRSWPHGALDRVYSLGASIRVYHGMPPSQPVYFADENLKTAVKAALGIATDPTVADMLALSRLDASYRGITDLTGLEYATNLTKLRLHNNQISQIGPLAALTSLIELWLEENQISDLSPLAGLTNLAWLRLSGNQISNLGPLANLTNLSDLVLSGNQSSDLGPLAGLTNLTSLQLAENQISDVSPLSSLVNLRGLVLYNNQISDLGPLANLMNLRELVLLGNQISDISPLARLTSLTYLNLGYNHISDIGLLAGLTNLTFLYLSGNQISDIGLLAALTNLTWLSLNENQIVSIGPLSCLTNLSDLELEYNQITDIRPLAGLTHLCTVRLGANPLNCNAYRTVIPQMVANNPGLWVSADPMPPECLEPQAEEIIEEVTEDLEDILTANPDTPLADNVGDAMAYAKAACDQLTTTPPNNRGAVQNVEKAVGELQEAVRKKLLDAGQGNQLMDQLAGAARQIAADAIEQARASGGKAGKIAEAERELADGDALRSAGAFERAVDKYKDALVSAEKAI